jgi:carotenoid cleavage dioxygenase
MTNPFPNTADFSGFNQPARIECDISDLVVQGCIPDEIDGAWYRMTPDPQYPPLNGQDTFLSGDGMMSMFRIAAGHVDFKMRYVQTPRLQAERAARGRLFGDYRNPFTDNPSVRHLSRATANTTPIWHAGKLLAAKEDERPYRMDPLTLATLGPWDFEGALRSQTMTAHPRIDPDTGEMFVFGQEAGGIATRDVSYAVIDRRGKLVSEEWFQAPYAALIHDFAVTKQHVVFPVFPTTADLQRIRSGGPHWIWEPGRSSCIGVMPRGGSVKQLRWFTGPAFMAYHIMNAFSAGDWVHLDLTRNRVNQFPFIREASGIVAAAEDIPGDLVRWTFDLASKSEGFSERVLGPGGDFPRIACRDGMREYGIGYYQTYDPAIGPPLNIGPAGFGFNTILRINLRTGALQKFAPGPRITVQEHVHIRSGRPGHEGYLAFVADLHEHNLSEVMLLEAAHLERGPIARISMPLRLRCQFHGVWVPGEQLPH